MKKIFILLILSITTALLVQSCQQEEEKYYQFTENGELMRPVDYRTWVFVGSAATPKSLDSTALFPDFQNVYMDPDSYRFWKEKGYYKEGTIFVKELLRKGDTVSPIGRGFYQGPHYSLSATIKDTVRFPDVKGGWQYFKFTNYDKQLLNDSSIALGGKCISCHSLSKSGYGPFTEFYPILQDAKNYGKDNPENRNTRTGLDETMKTFKEEH
ncbi:cytochrome P460 [Echinicola soli]|uniref:Cytochrome P460 n=1 Tax=Echinicola soli TaxID=2591634 RepID=A0A514CFL3_9BACT|nr:cytochrome P460 family protein [Echinicola soli]QDH78550.1 cytochrome P460 [Echinicola soli]